MTLRNTLRTCWLGVVGAVAACSNAALAQTALDVTHLRTDCGTVAEPDCFETTDALELWLWTTRVPSPSMGDEVTVEVGPGTFDPFTCSGPTNGFVTLRGSGRLHTSFRDGAGTGPGISVTDCAELHFEDLRVEGTTSGIHWSEGGGAVFDDVDVVISGDTAATEGFAASCAEGGVPNTVWFGSRILLEATGKFLNIAFAAYCGSHAFHNGEIRVLGSDATRPGRSQALGILVAASASVEVFASVIRSQIGTATGTWFRPLPVPGYLNYPGLAGVLSSGGEFTMHGGIINTSAAGSTNPNNHPISIVGDDGATIRVLGAAFTLLNPQSPRTRLQIAEPSEGTSIEAPFQWPAGTDPPEIASLDGQDLFVETDCAPGGCAQSGEEAHLLIYNPSGCTGATDSDWLDANTGDCRSD